MIKFDQTNGSIKCGNATYYVPNDSEPLLEDDFANTSPAIMQLKYPVKGIPDSFIVPKRAIDNLSAYRPKIVVEIIRRWGNIPKGELARIVLGANQAIDKLSAGAVEKIAESIDFDAAQIKNELIAYTPLPAAKAPKGYPITYTEDE